MDGVTYTIYRCPSVSVFFKTSVCMLKRVGFDYVAVRVCMGCMHMSTNACGSQRRLLDAQEPVFRGVCEPPDLKAET